MSSQTRARQRLSEPRSGRSFGRSVKRLTLNGLLFLFAFTTLYPFAWIIYNSFKTRTEFSQSIFSLPSGIRFDSYKTIFERGDVFTALFNSLFNAVISTVVIVLIAFVIGYFLARFEFRGRRLLYLFFLIGLLLPIPALLVPVFLQYKSIGMLDNRYSLLLPYIAFGLSTAIFLIESYVRTIPVDIDEAAYIDGASLGTLMFRVVFPMCRPIVATVSILSFLASWNEFAFALVLLRNDLYKTIPLWLRTFGGQYSTDYPGMMAGMVIASIPIIIVYLFFSEKIVDGFAGSAVKL